MYKKIILFGLIISFIQTGHCSTRPKLQYLGAAIHFPLFGEQLPEQVSYLPFLFEGQYRIKVNKQEAMHGCILYAEPQINMVFLKPKRASWELGLNLGIAYQLMIRQRNHLFFGIGSGPHYFPTVTAHQSRGFLFSDNFTLEYGYHFKKNWVLTTQIRFRHISNLDIQLPNNGLDNLLFGIGFLKRIG